MYQVKKISADDITKYFSYFCQKIGFDILCKLFPKMSYPKETICVKYQSLKYSAKHNKNIIILSPAEVAQTAVKDKVMD